MGKGFSAVSALRGHGYGGYWPPCSGAVMERAGTAQRGQLLGVGTTVTPGADLLGAQRWHGHRDHGGGVRQVDYLIQGILQGFRLRFGYSEVQLRSGSCNMWSTEDNTEVVEQYLVKECGAVSSEGICAVI